jgi:DNA-binding transcriptional regulator GbsR (MarR family)
MGRLAEFLGFRRNLGRTWAVLYLDGDPLTATDLQKRLKLSTGAVSMTLNELQRWGVIRREMRPGERQKLYVAEVDVWRVVSRMLRGRELVEVDGAVDSLERALTGLREERDRLTGSDKAASAQKVRRVEGLLDLMRIIASVLRLLVTTGRLDASVLAGYRLGQESDDDEGIGGNQNAPG